VLHQGLSDDQIRALVGALSITRELEIDCSECRDMVAEFAERELAGIAGCCVG
jgi:hypothetical protein